MLTTSELKQVKHYLELYSKKDSQLPPATTPLNVDDKVAILQLGQNRLVTIKDLFEAADLGDITFQDCPMTDYKRWEEEGTLKLNVVYVCNYDETYPAPADDDTGVMQIYLNSYPFIKDNTKYIYDDNQDKYQKEINQEIYNTLGNLEENKADKSDTYTKTEVDNIVDAETTRATNVEEGINARLQTVEELAEISVGGGDIGIATASDFENPTPEQKAKVPTVGAMLDGYVTVSQNTSTGDNSLLAGSTKIGRFADADKLIKLTGIGTMSGGNSGVTQVGDVYYNPNVKKLFRCTVFTSSTDFVSVEVPYYDGAIYALNNDLYIWNGTDLIAKTKADDEPTAGSGNLAESGGVSLFGKHLNNNTYIEKDKLIGRVSGVIHYYNSTSYDCIWIFIPKGTSKVYLNNVQHDGIFFFFTSPVPSTDSYRSNNTTGVVPSNSVMCLINLSKALNPDGYDATYVTFDNNIDEIPTEGSSLPVKSGGIKATTVSVGQQVGLGDLSFNDFNGNSLGYIGDGHLKLKNFDSKTASKVKNLDATDFFDLKINDNNENPIVGFYDGHILTKNFSSEQTEDRLQALEARQRGFRPGTFSVLGDSLSTFAGWIPDGYLTWYPNADNNVKSYAECYWALFAREYHCRLLKLNAYSGSPVSYDGYGPGQKDALADGSSFLCRTSKEDLGEPELIIVNGGTNDSSPEIFISAGDYQYSDWTEDDLVYFRPALAKLLHDLKETHLGATILVIQNTWLRTEIAESFAPICEHYNVPLLVLHDISRQNGHYDINGMRSVADQIMNFLDTIQ